MKISSLTLPPSPGHLHPLLCVSLQFLVYCWGFYLFIFLQGRESICPGGYAGLSQGWLGEYPIDAWCSPIGLPNVSQAGLELCLAAWELSCFLSVTWCGEAFHLLGVQCFKDLILLGALFLPSVVPVSQQVYWFMELILSASAP
jgi:hypothetical protein